MKKTIILLLLQIAGVPVPAQNYVLDFKSGTAPVKKGETIIPERNVSSNQNYIDLEYHFEEAAVVDIKTNNETFQLVKIKGLGLMGEVGKPALPAYNDILAVPAKNGLSVQIIESQYTEFENFHIHPALEPQPDNEVEIKPRRFILDETTYSSNRYFPENLAEIVSIQDYRDVPLAFVQIRPIQYNPVSKKLRCYSKIKYRIVFENRDAAKTVRTEQKSYDILRNILSNPDIMPELSGKNQAGQLRTGPASGSGISKDYIIITTDRFLPAVQEFAAWKVRLGYRCDIVSQASWTTSQVKDSVHTRYHNWDPKPEFLLIVGDHGDVPGETYHATDLYYTCMGDSSDYTRDMACGRVSVNSLEQARLVLGKIIDYERNPAINPSFYQTGLHCADFEEHSDPNPIDGYEDRANIYTSETVRDSLMKKGKTINRVYSTYNADMGHPRYYNNDFYSTGGPIPPELRRDIAPFYPWDGKDTDIITEINAGRFYVLYRGHGAPDKWQGPPFTTANIESLTNGNQLPVVFSIACQTGKYKNSECFAEKFLRHPAGGAVGIFAAIETSYAGFNEALAIGMFDAIWSNPGLIPAFGSGGVSNPTVNSHSDIYKMGHVLNQGLLRMEQTWMELTLLIEDGSVYVVPASIYEDYRHHNEIYHYFGDPSMEIYTEVPSTFANPVISQTGNNVTVNTGGVPDCTIVLSSMDDAGASYFQAVRNVSSHTFADVFVPVNITLSKHNYVPHCCTTANLTNQIIRTDQTIVGCNDLEAENVTVTDNAELKLDAPGSVKITGGFKVESGSKLKIK